MEVKFEFKKNGQKGRRLIIGISKDIYTVTVRSGGKGVRRMDP
jgi:hypothetical protein